MAKKKFSRGDRVCVTGKGRTKNWGKLCGVVLESTKNNVDVAWDGTRFLIDGMETKELRKVGRTRKIPTQVIVIKPKIRGFE